MVCMPCKSRHPMPSELSACLQVVSSPPNTASSASLLSTLRDSLCSCTTAPFLEQPSGGLLQPSEHACLPICPALGRERAASHSSDVFGQPLPACLPEFWAAFRGATQSSSVPTTPPYWDVTSSCLTRSCSQIGEDIGSGQGSEWRVSHIATHSLKLAQG